MQILIYILLWWFQESTQLNTQSDEEQHAEIKYMIDGEKVCILGIHCSKENTQSVSL